MKFSTIKSKKGCVLIKSVSFDESGLEIPEQTRVAFINYNSQYTNQGEVLEFLNLDTVCELKKVNNSDKYFECTINES